VRPSEYEKMERGERTILRAFLEKEIQQINKEREVE
jgi:hypothetical protein